MCVVLLVFVFITVLISMFPLSFFGLLWEFLGMSYVSYAFVFMPTNHVIYP